MKTAEQIMVSKEKILEARPEVAKRFFRKHGRILEDRDLGFDAAIYLTARSGIFYRYDISMGVRTSDIWR